jgi:hypothetical protein
VVDASEEASTAGGGGECPLAVGRVSLLLQFGERVGGGIGVAGVNQSFDQIALPLDDVGFGQCGDSCDVAHELEVFDGLVGVAEPEFEQSE